MTFDARMEFLLQINEVSVEEWVTELNYKTNYMVSMIFELYTSTLLA